MHRIDGFDENAQSVDAREFDAQVAAVLSQLPEWAVDALRNIEILIEDRASEVLDDEDDLLGLYIGTPLPEREANYAGELPDVIYIFREPHLSLGLGPDALRNEIATTVVHEVAHYFGLSDEQLESMGWG